ISLMPIYPFFTLSWYLSLVVTIMMIERQISRSISIYNVYGIRSVFFACFLPPILPIRIIWGNIINLTATIKAYMQSFSGNKEKKKTNQKNKTFAWSKTDHTFLPKEVLSRYHRTFGAVLIENVKGIQYVNTGDFSSYDLSSFASKFDKDLLEELMVLPIVFADDSYVLAYGENTTDTAQTILREKMGIKIISAFTCADMVKQGLNIMFGNETSAFKATTAFDLLNAGKINTEQYIIVCNNAINMDESHDE
ncbi:hypothetical protein JZU68_05095, partial [bacterium]|nr:hypothetical protein [bacterium]